MLWVIPGADGEGTLYEDQGDSEAYKDGEFATTLFTQTHSAEGTLLTINAREGSYEGMLQERAWQAVFFSIEEPSNIYINGEETTDWTYDAQLRRLTVNVSSRPCSNAIIINVKEKDTGIEAIQNSRFKIQNDVFDLSGMNLSNHKLPRGIYIQSGKKILNPYKP